MRSRQFLTTLAVLFTGYVLGACFSPQATVAMAQQDQGGDNDYDETSQESMQRMHKALAETEDVLKGAGKYSAATNGPNSFAIAVGGVDAMRDLEQNRGVDPETFAAIYAGRANTEVLPHLSKDANGRVTYKGNVVRMYSRARLKKLFRRRDILSRAR